MKGTREKSRSLWKYVKETADPKKMANKSAQLGVCDHINSKFSKQIFKFKAEKKALLKTGTELPDCMKQEVPQTLVDLEKDNITEMFNPFLELKVFV